MMRPIDPPPPPLPEHISLETLTAERAELYSHVAPPGRTIPIKMAPFPVDDTILGEEDIAKTVTRLWIHRAGGP